jgi:O-antigen/teichoic acid export membrane protein
MRLQKAVKNSFFGVLGQIILILVGFFSQRVMNLRLGTEMVGMNGVISNIIAILSVTELGVASAIVYNLYAALAKGDEEEIAALMNFYRKAYYAFAATITLLGLLILPFVPRFLKNSSFAPSYIRFIYLLWLARTVLSYLLSYRRSILIADQREYVVSIVTLFVNVLNYSTIIVVVELTGNYAAALLLNIVFEAAGNLWISAYVKKKYPFLVRLRKAPLDPNVVSKVFANIRNIFIMRLSTKLLVSTDNLIISGVIGVATAGLYNNYCLVTQSLINIVQALSGAIQPSVGHMFIEGDQEKNCRVLRQVSFLFFVIASAASAALFSLITPFVADLWLEKSYLLERQVVIVYVINFCVFTLTLPIQMMMGVTGLFDKERNISIFVAIVNLILSLALSVKIGLTGVLLGTLAAYLLQALYRIRVFFRDYVKLSSRRYVLDMAGYAVVSAIDIIVVYWITTRVYRSGSVLRFLAILVIAGVVPLLIDGLLYFRSWRFQSLWEMAKRIIGRNNPEKEEPAD